MLSYMLHNKMLALIIRFSLLSAIVEDFQDIFHRRCFVRIIAWKESYGDGNSRYKGYPLLSKFYAVKGTCLGRELKGGKATGRI